MSDFLQQMNTGAPAGSSRVPDAAVVNGPRSANTSLVPKEPIETGTVDSYEAQRGPSMADALQSYTPNSAIAHRYRMAELMNEPTRGTGWASVVASGLGGLTSSLYRNSAEQALRDNQEITRSGIRSAGGAGNSSLMARALLESGDPEQAKLGLTTLLKGDTAALDAELKRSLIGERNARAGYYGRNLAGAGSMDATRWENLIQRAAKSDDGYADDPIGTIEKYREAYGQARSGYRPASAPSRPAGGSAAPARPPGAALTPLDQAREAIANGADRGQVMQRLQQLGIDATGL